MVAGLLGMVDLSGLRLTRDLPGLGLLLASFQVGPQRTGFAFVTRGGARLATGFPWRVSQ